jgi:hypothetical protein
MRWGRRAAALALIAAVAGGGLRVAGAQSITISVPIANDSISPAPPILVEGTPGPPSLGPYSLTLEAALEPQFRAPIIISASSDLTLSVQADSLFPEHAAVFFRARLIDGQGQVIRQDLRSFNVRSWLRLISPTRLSNDVLFTRQPRFVWSSPGITLPPGPWRYTLSIINTKNGHEDFQFQPTDTSFVVPTPLEACTSYSWRLTARAINGGSKNQITVASPGTFVIQTAECPTATIFYQNFPNPFGHGSMSDITCFWFDLAREANVKLTIYDVRPPRRSIDHSGERIRPVRRRRVWATGQRRWRMRPTFLLGWA